MKNDLLIEIGVEELPASFLAPAADAFRDGMLDFLKTAGLEAGTSRVCYTPRRIALIVEGTADRQADQLQEIQGPPAAFAFDKDNKPTRAGLGFAKTHGVPPADLFRKTTPKGEYLCAKKEVKGRETVDLLAEFLPGAILALPFPKTMRWTEAKTRFGRPIRWLLALFGDRPISFEINGVKSGVFTFGHRFHGAEPVTVPSPAAYEKILKANFVVPAFEERKKMIRERLSNIAANLGAKIVEDEELLAESANVVEWPSPILCEFNRDYLALPPVVVVTALKAHQRCFSLVSTSGAPLAKFIAVTNTPGTLSAGVKTWVERMVGSRLADAKFYWDEDVKTGLEPLVEAEKRVTWIEGLGTLHDKTGRLKELCRTVVQVLKLDPARFPLDHLLRAAELSKADLLTNMVREKEFTALQGIMGGRYAAAAGEPDAVVRAIEQHYENRGDLLGALLGIADKIDNIAASFITGAIPTGSQDPFALRRQANAIIAALTARYSGTDAPAPDGYLRLPLGGLVEATLALYQQSGRGAGKTAVQLREFLTERLRSHLIDDRNLRYDVVDAVLPFALADIVDCENRGRALAGYRDRPDFADLVTGQKRVANILRGLPEPGPVAENRFVEPEEKALFHKARSSEPEVAGALGKADYTTCLDLLLGLRTDIDAFFDKVLVMDKDENLRANRLALLGYVKSLFFKVADLSKVVLEGEKQ